MYESRTVGSHSCQIGKVKYHAKWLQVLQGLSAVDGDVKIFFQLVCCDDLDTLHLKGTRLALSILER